MIGRGETVRTLLGSFGQIFVIQCRFLFLETQKSARWNEHLRLHCKILSQGVLWVQKIMTIACDRARRNDASTFRFAWTDFCHTKMQVSIFRRSLVVGSRELWDIALSVLRVDLCA